MSPRREVREAAAETGARVPVGRPRHADERATPYASPARDLQASLAEHLEAALPEESQRWPGAVRLAIICGGSAATWAGVVMLCRAALKL